MEPPHTDSDKICRANRLWSDGKDDTRSYTHAHRADTEGVQMGSGMRDAVRLDDTRESQMHEYLKMSACHAGAHTIHFAARMCGTAMPQCAKCDVASTIFAQHISSILIISAASVYPVCCVAY